MKDRLSLIGITVGDLGIENPKIVIPGLNPHVSDGGLFGDEEEKEIIPAMQQAKQEDIDVEGPMPPDTAFIESRSGQYDVALATYHVQGHLRASKLKEK